MRGNGTRTGFLYNAIYCTHYIGTGRGIIVFNCISHIPVSFDVPAVLVTVFRRWNTKDQYISRFKSKLENERDDPGCVLTPGKASIEVQNKHFCDLTNRPKSSNSAVKIFSSRDNAQEFIVGLCAQDAMEHLLLLNIYAR